MKRQSGQTLIEIMVALSIAVVIISATSVAVINALSNADFTKTQSIATQAAQQAIESLRSMRNNDYQDFISLNGNYCMASTCTSVTNASGTACSYTSDATGISTCGQNVDTLVRVVNITPQQPGASDCNAQGPKVVVNVYWSDAKCTSSGNVFCHSVTVSTCLSDYHVEPTL